MRIRHLEFVETPQITDVTNPHRLIAKHIVGRLGMKQAIFGHRRWERNLVGDIANPSTTNFTITFRAGMGSKKAGYKPQAQYFLIDNHLWKRISWVDLGIYADSQTGGGKHRRQNGLQVKRKNSLVYYVVSEAINDDLREAIAREL
jgi:hypothetical protein